MILTSSYIAGQLCGLDSLNTEVDPMGGKMVRHHFYQRMNCDGVVWKSQTA